jgi:uncharacterized membrane protein
MNITLHLFIMLISFSIAFLGVIILFNIDALTGGLMATGGVVLFLKSIER